MKKILVKSTTKAKLCSHPILVSVDEIKKAELEPIGEKNQELSSAPPQSIEVQPTMLMVVYQREDTMSLHINTSVRNVLVHTVSTDEKDGTPIQIG